MFILTGVYCLILQKLLDMFAENLKQATSFTLHRAFRAMGITLSHLNLQINKPHPLLTKRQNWKYCIPHEMIFLDYNKSVEMLSLSRIIGRLFLIGREAKRLSVSYSYIIQLSKK